MNEPIQQNTQASDQKVKYPFHEIIFKKEWSYATGAVLLSALALVLVIVTGHAWGVTGPFTLWGAKFISLFGVDVAAIPAFKGVAEYNFWKSVPSMTDLGIVAGALIAVLLAAQFKIKKIKSWRNIAAAVLGGLFMGIGSRLALGCNIGSFFSALPAFSLHGWVFLVAIFLGALLGSILLKKYFMGGASKKKSARSAVARLTPEQRKRKRMIQIIIGVVLIAAYLVLCIFIQGINPKGAFILMIGLGFGYVLQRSRFCFTAAFRDPSLTGSTSLTKAVILALMLSSVVFAALQIKITGLGLETLALGDLPGNIKAVGLHTLLGGFIFGIGAVVAGGCASGTLMRMGEGFVQQWIAIVFFVIGSMIGSAVLIPIQKTFLYSKNALYLPQMLGGWVPALIVQFGVLIGLYILADWYGKKKSGELK
ncbi:MAG: YeeE/YedE thiosulfate transporter family protein [Clostridia bacterium]